MKLITQKEMLEYLKKLIISYEKEDNNKELIAKDIYYYCMGINNIVQLTEDPKFLEFGNDFYDYYSNELEKHLHLNETFENEDIIETEKKLNFGINFDIEELTFILYILKKINISYYCNDIESNNPIEKLKKYLSTDKSALNYFKSLDNNIWYHSSFGESTSIKSSNNKGLILTNTFDISVILYEFIRLYYNTFEMTKYKNTSSILGKMAISSYYDFVGNKDFFKDIKLLKKENLSIDEINFLYAKSIQSAVDSIISLSFIHKNGNEFNAINNGIKTIIENKNQSIENLLNSLKITEKDIFDSFNNVDKILKYKKI